MSQEPLLPSYGAATHRPHSSEYRLIAKHTHTALTPTDILCAIPFLISAIFATTWAADVSDTTPTGSAPLLPYFASMILVVSTCFWLGYLISIAGDRDGGSVLQRKTRIGVAVLGKLVLGAAHVAVWQAYRIGYEGLATPNWVVVFMAAQAWFDVVFVAVRGWVL